MISVAEIAAKAFTAVSGAMSGVIKPATLTRTTQGVYDPATGSYTTTTVTTGGRAIFDTSKPVEDVFPAYVIGPGESLVYFEGLSWAPKETDEVTIDGQNYRVAIVSDVLHAGGLYAAIVVANG